MRNFRELIVWQKSHALTLGVYRVSKTFPREELYGLVSQVRRAASSVPANIAEGSGRDTDPEMHRFLTIALGSTTELEYHLILCKDLGYLDGESYNHLNLQTEEIKRMLITFVRKLRSRP